MNEVWKPIPGYEGFYEASDLGRIRSLHTKKRHRAKSADGIVAQCDLRGYKTCVLSKDGERCTKMIHRVIAMTFLGMPVDSKNTVNHKDLNKSNNAPENLEWLSLTENIRHASKLIPRLRGEKNRSKLTESNVKAIRDRYIPRQTTLKQLAEEYGVSEQTVHAIVHRKKWAHV